MPLIAYHDLGIKDVLEIVLNKTNPNQSSGGSLSYFFNFLSSVVRNSQLIAITILFDGNMISR